MTGSSGEPPRNAEGQHAPRSKRRRRRRRGRRAGAGARPVQQAQDPSATSAPPAIEKGSAQASSATAGGAGQSGGGAAESQRAPGHSTSHPTGHPTGSAGSAKSRRRRRRGPRPADGGQGRQAPSGGQAGAQPRPNGAATERAGHKPRGATHPRKRPQRPAGTDPNIYAALDLGTNNCRLLVARPSSHSFRVIDAFSRIVRLGEGLFHSGQLSEEAMDRSLEALSTCRDKLVSNGVNRYRLIATEACRKAANGAFFLDRVKQETGLNLEIVTRETEAELAVSGCASLIDPRATGVVVFDIGGGSTELAILEIRKRNGHTDPAISKRIIGWTSLPVGVVGIAERYGGVEVSPETFEAIVEDVAAMLTGFEALDALDKHARRNVHLLGTSGTVTTIAGVHLGLQRYDRRRVDGTWMGPASIRNVHQRLQSMSYEERAANACIGRERADLVLSGCAIFEAIRRRWPWARVRVADRGLREGILMTLMREDAVWAAPRRKRQ